MSGNGLCFNYQSFEPFNKSYKTIGKLYPVENEFTIIGSRSWYFGTESLIHRAIWKKMEFILDLAVCKETEKLFDLFMVQKKEKTILSRSSLECSTKFNQRFLKFTTKFYKNEKIQGFFVIFFNETSHNFHPLFIRREAIPGLRLMITGGLDFENYTQSNIFKEILILSENSIKCFGALQETWGCVYLIKFITAKKGDLTGLLVLYDQTDYEVKKNNNNNNNNNTPKIGFDFDNVLLEFKCHITNETIDFVRGFCKKLSTTFMFLDQKRIILDPCRPGYIFAFVEYLKKFCIKNKIDYILMTIEQSPSIMYAFLNQGFVLNVNDLEITKRLSCEIVSQSINVSNHSANCFKYDGYDYFKNLESVVERPESLTLIPRVGKRNFMRESSFFLQKEFKKNSFNPVINIDPKEWRRVMLYYIVNDNLL